MKKDYQELSLFHSNNMKIEQAVEKVMQDYDKTFRDLAKYENEPTIETHTDNSFWKYVVPVFLVLAVSYFIIRSI